MSQSCRWFVDTILLRSEVNKSFKILMKTSNVVEYIESDIKTQKY